MNDIIQFFDTNILMDAEEVDELSSKLASLFPKFNNGFEIKFVALKGGFVYAKYSDDKVFRKRISGPLP